jgi:hypothetical protein
MYGNMKYELAFSLKKVLLVSVLFNCVVFCLSSASIIILSCLFFSNNSGLIGFFELSIVVFLLIPIAGIIAEFKIGDCKYLFIIQLQVSRIYSKNQIE